MYSTKLIKGTIAAGRACDAHKCDIKALSGFLIAILLISLSLVFSPASQAIGQGFGDDWCGGVPLPYGDTFPNSSVLLPRFLTLPFGSPPPTITLYNGWFYTSDGNPHYGIDYISNWNSFDILAAADGHACYIPGNPTYGNFIRIRHSVNQLVLYTIYAHLADNTSSIQPNNWIKVPRGLLLGRAGNTGESNSIHLHFELSIGKWGKECNCKLDPYGISALAASYPQPGSMSTLSANNAFQNNRADFPPPICVALSGTNYARSIEATCQPPTTDNATFVSDITLPDGTAVTPGQSTTKTWRMKNTGTSIWGNGYQLVSREGNRLGAPQMVHVPSTSPGQEMDISVPLQIPSTAAPGIYRASWQFRNAQGTFFGPVIYFSLVIPNTQPPGNGVNIELVSINSPATITLGQAFAPGVTIRVTSGQLRQDRGDMLRFYSGTNYSDFPHVSVQGTLSAGQNYLFSFYSDHPMRAPSSPGDYESRWRVWANGGWVGPEIVIRFTVYQPGMTNRVPNRPTLTNPHDWAVFVGQMPNLCAQANGDPDADAITGYRFVIFESAQNWDSGWIGSSCVTPSGLGNYGYQWHVQVQDSRGGVSEWSDTRHFSIDSTTVTITDFHFEPASPSNVENVVCLACTSGCAGLNVHLKVLVNTATDGSADGEWIGLKELSVPCFNAQDAPTWPTLDYADGTHRLRVEATSCDGTVVTREDTYTIQRRKPSYPYLIHPANGFWSNSRSITFRWQASLRASNYTLIVGTTPDPEASPVLNLNVSATEYTATFSQDYTKLYWRVYANNEFGRTEQSGPWFGIDRTTPSSTINLGQSPTLVYENQFAISWTGTDNASGIQTYDVQFRAQPDSLWQDWLVLYPEASAIFTGQPGRTYDFRTRARDIAGNLGSFPPSAEISVKIDPANRPPQAWWNSAYAYKRNLVIANRMGNVVLPSGYPIQLHFDNSTTPTAADVYNASTASTKGHDVRIVLNDQTELARHVINFSASIIDMWFATQADIAESGSSSSYQMYYGNASPGAPPTNLGNVYAPRPDSQATQVWYFEENSGDTPDYSGHNSTIIWNGSPTRGIDNGRHGSGVRLTGSQWGVASNNVLIGGSQLTAEAWVLFDALSNTGFPTNQQWMGIVGKLNRWRLTLRDPGYLQADIQLLSGGVEYSERATYETTIQTGRWYHVAFTYDASRLRLWVDGVEVASAGRAGSVRDDGDPIWIGRNHSGDPPAIARIDGVRVSNVARSSFPYGKITSLPSSAAGQQTARVVTGQSDLAFRSLSVTSNPTGGLLVQAVVENQSAFETYNEFFVNLYNRLPNGPGDLNGSLGFWVNSPLAAAQTLTATTILTNTTGLLNRPLRLRATTEVSGTLYAQADSLGLLNETTKSNNISSGVSICMASPDPFENDGTPANAKTAAVGSTISHNLDVPGDLDWVKFTAQSGIAYTIQTSNLSAIADTYLYLYSTDGTTLIASNDDYGGSLASRIDWKSPASGTYFIMLKHWNPNVGGCGTSYDVSVRLQQVFRIIFFPMIRR